MEQTPTDFMKGNKSKLAGLMSPIKGLDELGSPKLDEEQDEFLFLSALFWKHEIKPKIDPSPKQRNS